MQRIGSLVAVVEVMVFITIAETGFASNPPILMEVFGNDQNQRAGTAIAGVGDVNADGIPDLVLGIPGDSTIWAVPGHGSARVVCGSTGAVIHYLIAPSPSIDYGNTVAAGGDLDLDGFVDVLVGAPSNTITSYGNGSAFAYSGSSGSLIFQRNGTQQFDRLGRSVTGIGDFDQDGYDDIAIGIPGSDAGGIDFGAVLIVKGQNGTSIATIAGFAGNSDFGISVAGPGDVNGDGLPDLLVGSPKESAAAPNGGAVRLYSGKDQTILHQWLGPEMNDVLGISLHAIPDIDGDGCMDALIGGYGGPMQEGSVQVRSTSSGASLVDIAGPGMGALLGLSTGALSDQDGDGLSEILAGAPLATGDGYQSGSVSIISTGGNSITLGEVSDSAPAQLFGFSVADLGDVDLDGRNDYAVGQPGYNTPLFDSAGRVVIYAGIPIVVSPRGTGCPGSGDATPTLQSESSPALGMPFAFHISSGLGNSLALLAASKTGAEKVQPNGCTVYLGGPIATILPVPLGGYGPGGGSATAWGQIPAVSLPGSTFEVQAFILDPGAFGGFTATNALSVLLP